MVIPSKIISADPGLRSQHPQMRLQPEMVETASEDASLL
jgi:hypothetical protein